MIKVAVKLCVRIACDLQMNWSVAIHAAVNILRATELASFSDVFTLVGWICSMSRTPSVGLCSPLPKPRLESVESAFGLEKRSQQESLLCGAFLSFKLDILDPKKLFPGGFSHSKDPKRNVELIYI